MRTLYLTLLLFPFFLSATPEAPDSREIHVWGRAYKDVQSTDRTTGEYDIIFKDKSLPPGTKVTLSLGFGGYKTASYGAQPTFDWDNSRTVPMKYTDKNTWRVGVQEALHKGEKPDAPFYTSVEFSFILDVPGEPTRYVKGGSPWGFFQVDSLLQSVPQEQPRELAKFGKLNLKIVKLP